MSEESAPPAGVAELRKSVSAPDGSSSPIRDRSYSVIQRQERIEAVQQDSPVFREKLSQLEDVSCWPGGRSEGALSRGQEKRTGGAPGSAVGRRRRLLTLGIVTSRVLSCAHLAPHCTSFPGTTFIATAVGAFPSYHRR